MLRSGRWKANNHYRLFLLHEFKLYLSFSSIISVVELSEVSFKKTAGVHFVLLNPQSPPVFNQWLCETWWDLTLSTFYFQPFHAITFHCYFSSQKVAQTSASSASNDWCLSIMLVVSPFHRANLFTYIFCTYHRDRGVGAWACSFPVSALFEAVCMLMSSVISNIIALLM